MSDLVKTQDEDFLEQDQPIRGQNFVCLSFISPEEVLKSKEQYFFEKFIEDFTKKTNKLTDDLEILFPDKKDQIRSFKESYDAHFNNKKVKDNFHYFVNENNEKLEKDFHEENNFQTSIRGIKIRGTYDTLKEAQVRAEVLRKKENNKFSIFVAQVGCWCPWSPNPDDISEQEFAETQLNTMMKKYHQNLQEKEEYYEQRKDDLKKRMQLEEDEKKKLIENENVIDFTDSNVDPSLIMTTNDPHTDKIINS
jgi:hypothetical protein